MSHMAIIRAFFRKREASFMASAQSWLDKGFDFDEMRIVEHVGKADSPTVELLAPSELFPHVHHTGTWHTGGKRKPSFTRSTLSDSKKTRKEMEG